MYPGTYQTGDATLYKSPPGKLVVELMLAGNPSGPASAHYAPFTPSGTTGQLAIGGTNVSSGAFVSALYHSDYQGTLTLSTAERTNVLPRSLLEGSGTTPTGWTYYTDTGTSAPASSTWSPGDGAQAWTITSTTGQNFIYQNFSVAANTVYCLSVLVESVTGSITAQNALYSGNFPAGASLEFPVCPANPSGGNFGIVQAGLLVALLRVAGTAGAATVYLGVGCAASNTGTVKFSRPQIEVGTQRTGFIPTSATTASITDYSYNDSGAVTLGQTATGAYSWSGSGLLASGGTTLTPTEGALTLAGQTPS
ncbi:MAG TPA: hypothetical protein VK150_05740, partial [Geothrix sp.]|nr:hypothetical protein [Geothrix sp.]